MKVSQLWKVYDGTPAYVVGTGPSLRVFPNLKEFFADKLTIGINQLWRFFTPTYSFTLHPELVTPEAGSPWIVKGRKSRDLFGNPVPRFDIDHPDHYVFLTLASDKTREVFERCGECSLYQSGGAQTSAIHLAYRMGASAVILVGCDMTSLDNEHHGHNQHVRWCGKAPADAYAEYRHHTRIVREELRKRGVPVLTLTPFVGCGHAEEDYAYLKDKLGLAPLPVPEDISGRRT